MNTQRTTQQRTKRLYFGGSFDPPHTGHLDLPLEVLGALQFDRLIYIPAAQSPHKTTKPTPSEHRVHMLNILLSGINSAEISTMEIDRAQQDSSTSSYWAHTWQSINQMHHDSENAFLIGADQALHMHRWHRFEEFWRDAVVMLRNDATSPVALIDQLRDIKVWTDEELDHWKSKIVVTQQSKASSTQVRQSLATVNTRELAIQGLPKPIHAYILKHQLYI